MAKKYRVLLHVGNKMLPTFIGLVDDHVDIRIVQITDIDDGEPLPPHVAPPSPIVVHARETGSPQPSSVAEVAPSSRYIGGVRFKGISGKELVTEILRSGPADLDELRRAFTHRNFAAASAAPTLSTMMRDGLVCRVSHGRYGLNPAHTSNGSSAA
jgi:hypothetical protein